MTMSRTATRERSTGETQVTVSLDLDGGEASASTGVGFLDHMLDLLARHGRLGLKVEASGDLETGAHHTVEDVGIVLGQALDEALDVLRRLRNWQVLDRSVALSGSSYEAAVRMRLDQAQLPRPLQLSALTNRELRLESSWRRFIFLPPRGPAGAAAPVAAPAAAPVPAGAPPAAAPASAAARDTQSGAGK